MRRWFGAATVAACVLLVPVLGASPAAAVSTGPGLTIESTASPSVFYPGDNGASTPDLYTLTVTNSGSLPTDGSRITVTDTLPAALSAQGVSGHVESGGGMECEAGDTVTCMYNGQLGPGDRLVVSLVVAVTPGAAGPVTNTATVSGGGAQPASTSEATALGSQAESLGTPFGLESFTDRVTGLDGLTDAQAGDHPYETTVSYVMNNTTDSDVGFSEAGGVNSAAAGTKDFVVDLPPGFLGNPDAIQRCQQFKVVISACPIATQIGVARIDFGGFTTPEIQPIYNVAPDKGFPAQFEFAIESEPVTLYATVNPETNYGVRITVPDIPALNGAIVGISTTFFGTPLTDSNYLNHNNGVSSGATPFAFLQNPTDCSTKPQLARVSADSWQHPGASLPDGSPDLSDPNWVSATTTVFGSLTGCDLLQFNPSITVTPETTRADEPTGVTVDLNVPQAPLVAPDRGTPELKDATVTLPAGLSLSPSAADGLQSCSEAQIGLRSSAPGACPPASVLGTAEIVTPLLAEPLVGQVFLETPGCDPCSTADASDGRMLRLFLEVAGSGVIVKKEGTVYANPSTGQLTTTFLNNPELPFSDLQLSFKGGLRASLATPQSCGTFTTTSDLVSWSTPVVPDANPVSPFEVSWDGNGGACPAVAPLNPGFSAGTSNPNAGQFSPLTITFSREDREQDLSGIQVKTPPGLLGMLSSVTLCGEPQADLGTCGAVSRIGNMTVAAGAGSHPFYEQGQIYLTGPYGGAPFGLSIVVPTVAGPFNLGNVVVRARIDVDPHTAGLTVTSDPFPQIIDGIPLRLRTANVTIDRPGFIFNPTDCAQQAISATISGAQGAQAQVSAPFAVSGCSGLPFGPKFVASTSGHTSRSKGASLDAKLVYPKGPQSNITSVKVELPRQLPSRLTTLQKACPDAVFNANPASCPTGALIGVAKAVTPLLPVPLSGPAYFVSHGGAAFPDLIVVLQGYGVRVDLIGSTFISKKGITSSTFKTVPDVPVSSFELYLPEGTHSALAANGNLCKQKLAMPTSFIAQDGARLQQSTQIKVTGCPKARKTNKAKKAGKAGVGSAGQPRGGQRRSK